MVSARAGARSNGFALHVGVVAFPRRIAVETELLARLKDLSPSRAASPLNANCSNAGLRQARGNCLAMQCEFVWRQATESNHFKDGRRKAGAAYMPHVVGGNVARLEALQHSASVASPPASVVVCSREAWHSPPENHGCLSTSAAVGRSTALGSRQPYKT